jgi:ubiquinone biosynthesis protein
MSDVGAARSRSWIGRWLFDVCRAAVLAMIIVRTFAPLLGLRLLGKRHPPEVIGERVRMAFERLGVTYLKLGQFLAMRFDILPEEVCRELARLFDEVPPMALQDVVRTIEEELGASPDVIFVEFENEPLAAASIAQVHRAVVPGGGEVAVKVQRPRIREIFAADIRNLKRLAAIGDALRLLGPTSVRGTVEEFRRFTSREMNFVTEGRTAERLRRNVGPFDDVPDVYWDYTTERVLTMEFVDAPSLAQILHAMEEGETKMPAGTDPQQMMENLADATLRQLFVTGFYHADPHPGNILIRPDNTVVFVDFGIFGQFAPDRREMFASFIEDNATGNIEEAYRRFMPLLEPTAETDLRKLRVDIQKNMRDWYDASRDSFTPLENRHLGAFFGKFITIVRRNKVRMALDTLLFWRTLVVLDATALRFSAQFDLLAHLRGFFERERPSPMERILTALTSRDTVRDVAALARNAPRDMQQQLANADEPRPRLTIRHGDARQRARAANDDARRIAAAVVALAMLLLLTGARIHPIGEVMIWTTLASTAAALWMRRASS